jgi:transcriptional regulator with XRE-family HTH domain
LREIRLARGMSQDQLAQACDFDRTYRSLLERGLRSPTLMMAFRIAEALGVASDLLVTKARERYDAELTEKLPHSGDRVRPGL